MLLSKSRVCGDAGLTASKGPWNENQLRVHVRFTGVLSSHSSKGLGPKCQGQRSGSSHHVKRYRKIPGFKVIKDICVFSMTLFHCKHFPSPNLKLSKYQVAIRSEMLGYWKLRPLLQSPGHPRRGARLFIHLHVHVQCAPSQLPNLLRKQWLLGWVILSLHVSCKRLVLLGDDDSCCSSHCQTLSIYKRLSVRPADR